MAFDFNEMGRTYQTIAAGRPAGFAMLSPEPSALFERLRAQQGREYTAAAADRQRWLLNAAGCLHRLDGFLFQLSRVAAHATSLRGRSGQSVGLPAPETGSMLVLSADEACYDFEGLLLQARAALDRLTWFIAGQHGQKCNRFTKLRAVLANFVHSNPRAEATLRLLDQVDTFDGVLVDAEGSKALRSVVAHYSSVPEGRQIAFTIHFIGDGRRLIFDCEALGRPLLATAETLGIHVPFLVLNSVAIYSGLEGVLLDGFTPMWSNPSVSFTEYRDNGDTALRFTVANMLPSGFSVTTHPLKREVLDHAISGFA